MSELQAAQEKLDKLQNELAAQQKIVDDLKNDNGWPTEYDGAISSKIFDKVEWLITRLELSDKKHYLSIVATVKLWNVISAIENDLTWVERANKCERWVVSYNPYKGEFTFYHYIETNDIHGIEFSCSTKEKAEHLITYFSELLKQAMMI